MGRWRRRLSYLLRQSRYEAELLDEIDAHRSLRQAHLEREGLTPSEAGVASRRELGNLLLVREEAREAWLGSWDTWWQDIGYALRMLRRSPGVATQFPDQSGWGRSRRLRRSSGGDNQADFAGILACHGRAPDPREMAHGQRAQE